MKNPPRLSLLSRLFFLTAATVMLLKNPCVAQVKGKTTPTPVPTDSFAWVRDPKFWGEYWLLFLLAPVALYLYAKPGGGSRKNKMASATFAGSREIAKARKRGVKQVEEQKRDGLTVWINTPHQPGRLAVGTAEKHKLVLAPNSSTIVLPDGQRGMAVIGAPGSGKSFGVINPAVRSAIEQGCSLIVYDFKFGTPGSQAQEFGGWAAKHGYEVCLFAPGFEGSMVCNPLDFLKDADDGDTAKQIATVLTRNFSLNGGKGGDDPFFQLSGDQLVKAVLQLAKASTAPDFLTCQKLLALDPKELAERVKASEISDWIKVSWDQFISMRESEKTAASVMATAALMFANFATPDILPSVCGKSNLPLDVEGKKLIIFGMDQSRRDVVGPILATVMHMIVTRNIAKMREGPLGVILDEFPTISLPYMQNWLSESRSAGFCGVLGMQNLGQLERAYGKEAARAIMTGCNTKVIFNPGEVESAKLFSEFIGQEHIDYKSKSRSRGKGGPGTSIADQQRTRALVSHDEMLRFDTGTCCIINPAYANKTDAFVPLKLTIKLNRQEMANIAISLKAAPILFNHLKQRFPRREIGKEEFKVREQAIDVLLSKKSSTSKFQVTTPIEAVENALYQDGSKGTSALVQELDRKSQEYLEYLEFKGNLANEMIDSYEQQSQEEPFDLSLTEIEVPEYVPTASPPKSDRFAVPPREF